MASAKLFDSELVWEAVERPQNSKSTSFSQITTDTRKITPGALFVAIAGEKFDGHAFLKEAVEKGAKGVLVKNGTPRDQVPAETLFFEAKDTVQAYRKLAQLHRLKFKIPIIVVAGSVGKTTTKELLASILRGKFSRVLSTQGSQNGVLGIPMTLLELRDDTDIAVVEVGIDDVGMMAGHIDLVRPTASLLTAIGPEHLDKLIDLATVAKEEALALSLTAESGGITVHREDDDWIRSISKRIKSRARVWRCSFGGVSEKTDGGDTSPHIVAESVPPQDKVQFHLPGGSQFELTCPLPGVHNAGNLTTAVTMAVALGLNPIEIQRGLSTFRGVYGRSEMKGLPGDTPVLCDYYNANPQSVAAALDVLSQISKGVKRKWALLGDMLELGPEEERFHRELAKKIIASQVDHVLLYGTRMKWLQNELTTQGKASIVTHFGTHHELAQALLHAFHLGDALLIKGSRGMKMEEAWKIIEPELLKKTP